MDIVPNPWRAHDFGQDILTRLLARYDEEVVVNNFVFIIEEFRKHMAKEKDRLAEAVFRNLVSTDQLRFLGIANDLLWKLPKKKRARGTRLNKRSGGQLERSLFDIVPADDLNDMEKRVAWYLDDQDKWPFWYRNLPKGDDYGVQGWRRNRVYPDFIFTDVDETADGFNRVFVVETKGLHLKDYEDTRYKKALFDMCNDLATEISLSQLGRSLKDRQISFMVVDEDQWEQRFNQLFA